MSNSVLIIYQCRTTIGCQTADYDIKLNSRHSWKISLTLYGMHRGTAMKVGHFVAAHVKTVILREIERSDNEALRSKKDVMEAFIKTRFYELPEEADIQDAYEQFEREALQAEMEEFSYEKGIDYLIINDIFTDFVFTQTVSEEAIRKRLEAYHFGLLKMNAMTNEIKGFVTDTYKKYKAEGE